MKLIIHWSLQIRLILDLERREKLRQQSGDQVTSIAVTNSGNGYQVNDVLTFDNTGTNSDATASPQSYCTQ